MTDSPSIDPSEELADQDLTVWRRAPMCASSGCLELRQLGDLIALRDSKVADGPVLEYTRDEFRVFVEAVKAGHFDDLAFGPPE